MYVLRVGCPWRDLPSVYGPWSSVYTRWRRWCQCGLWARLLALLARQAQGKLRFLDASHVKVHQDASHPAGGQQNQAIGRTKGGLNTKVNVWGWPGSSGESELGSGTAPRCASRKRQRDRHYVARLQWPTKVTTATVFGSSCGVGQSLEYPATLQPAYTRGVASWSLPTASPSGELVSTTETLPQNWHSL